MLQWKTLHVHHLVYVWVYLEEKFLELEPLKSQRTGYMYLKFDSFSQIAHHRFVSAYGHTSKVCEYLLPFLCQYSLFSAFFGFAKPYVKNNISYFTLPFSCYEWCQESYHMIESQLYFLFWKLSALILCLFSYWDVGLCLLLAGVTFILRKLTLSDTNCNFPP